MDHCEVAEVLFFALCGLPGGPYGELSMYPTMSRVIKGHEPFGVLQRKRIDWEQHIFEKERVAKEWGNLVTKETAEAGERVRKRKRPRSLWMYTKNGTMLQRRVKKGRSTMKEMTEARRRRPRSEAVTRDSRRGVGVMLIRCRVSKGPTPP